MVLGLVLVIAIIVGVKAAQIKALIAAGDLLIEQDTSTERAQLRAAQSEAALQKNNVDRVAILFKSNVASKSEYDSAQNAYQAALASADNIRASIEKKSIRAPFEGRLGIRLVNLGQSIDAGQPVVSLQATNQMFVNFFLPQQNLARLAKNLVVRLRSDAVPGHVFEGKINAINPEINTQSRSVEVQAILENTNNQLLPGMFANIEVILPDINEVLIIPITAVQYASYGDSVFVIEKQNENSDALNVRQQFVRLGAARGDYIVVEKGLSAGDTIVTTGAFKLRNGAPIVSNNTVVPKFSLSPSLPDR